MGGAARHGMGASAVRGALPRARPVLVLIAAMMIGSDGTGWIDFGDYELARTIGIIALALILFEGGLASGWERWAGHQPPIGLATSARPDRLHLVPGPSSWLFDFSTLEGLLLGSVLGGHGDCAVFFPADVHAAAQLARTLEGESWLNVPVALLL